jgi:hypothetical protein
MKYSYVEDNVYLCDKWGSNTDSEGFVRIEMSRFSSFYPEIVTYTKPRYLPLKFFQFMNRKS